MMTTATASPADRQMVSVERREATAIIRFANPPHGTIPARGAIQLHAALTDQLADPAIRAIILTGGLPGIFIRHADVASIARSAQALAEGRIKAEDFGDNPFMSLIMQLDRAEKPVIAAIDGLCMGGGLEIALACTMRVASPAATAIGLPEVRLDITPGAGGVPHLARMIGPHRARLFALKGTILDAAQAVTEGIVDELADNALDRALEIAAVFARRHPAALAAILRSSYLDASPEETARQFGQVVAEPEVRARVERFVANGERLDELD